MKDLSEASNFLDEIRIPLRLTAKTSTGWPVVISLWFQYQNSLLFCATQKTARIVSYLEIDPRCAFEIAPDHPPYRGVRGQALAQIDYSKGKQVLEQLLYRYVGGLDNPFAKRLLAKSDNEVAIILDPKRVYTWDFSNRMKEISPQMLALASSDANL